MGSEADEFEEFAQTHASEWEEMYTLEQYGAFEDLYAAEHKLRMASEMYVGDPDNFNFLKDQHSAYTLVEKYRLYLAERPSAVFDKATDHTESDQNSKIEYDGDDGDGDDDDEDGDSEDLPAHRVASWTSRGVTSAMGSEAGGFEEFAQTHASEETMHTLEHYGTFEDSYAAERRLRMASETHVGDPDNLYFLQGPAADLLPMPRFCTASWTYRAKTGSEADEFEEFAQTRASGETMLALEHYGAFEDLYTAERRLRRACENYVRDPDKFYFHLRNAYTQCNRLYLAERTPALIDKATYHAMSEYDGDVGDDYDDDDKADSRDLPAYRVASGTYREVTSAAKMGSEADVFEELAQTSASEEKMRTLEQHGAFEDLYAAENRLHMASEIHVGDPDKIYFLQGPAADLLLMPRVCTAPPAFFSIADSDDEQEAELDHSPWYEGDRIEQAGGNLDDEADARHARFRAFMLGGRQEDVSLSGEWNKARLPPWFLDDELTDVSTGNVDIGTPKPSGCPTVIALPAGSKIASTVNSHALAVRAG